MVMMQACYVNTTHPDFIGGHKAMALVQDRLNANKPPEKIDAKKNAINNGKDLDVDPKKDDSFFGSFFSKDKKQQHRKGGPVMEAPPPSIKPVSQLNDRELMETEVIKL
jgi:dynamin 1-like protein